MVVVPAQLVQRLAGLAGVGELYRFLLMTGLSASITLIIPIILREIVGLDEKIAVGLALVVAAAVNFITVRNYVFRSDGAILPQLIRFALSSLVFRGSEYLAFLLLHTFADMFYVLALGIVLVVSFVLKFLFYRVFVFGAAEFNRHG